jgi:hypothetical protein
VRDKGTVNEMSQEDRGARKIRRAEAILQLFERQSVQWLEQARKVLTWQEDQLGPDDYTTAKFIFQELQSMCVAIGEGIAVKEERSARDRSSSAASLVEEKAPSSAAPSRMQDVTEQAVFLFCPNCRIDLQALVDDVEKQIADHHLQAKIGVYGVGMKQQNGFVLVVSESPLPGGVKDWFKENSDILEYVVLTGKIALDLDR